MRLTHPTGDEAIDLDKVDLVDPVLHAEGDPHAIWLAMRTYDPVHWQQLRPDLGFGRRRPSTTSRECYGTTRRSPPNTAHC
ncbi:hypothetical protein ACFY3G_47180 [Streptomyces phaeochromogenes]|uniref:hypothetical protein n=1 Tax=Streptomyces phaeochromogenes TaxID=1923 RepID=UPI0036C69F8D